MADNMLDASELLQFDEMLDDASRRAAEGAYPIVKEHALKLRDRWRENAKETAGRHGRHYPRSITAEQVFDRSAAEWEVGPDSALPQGGMGRGFEFGSINQPPHLDGAWATIETEPEFNAAVDNLTRSLL
ncbi:hypothetical protein [Streptosporangium sandarakinum]